MAQEIVKSSWLIRRNGNLNTEVDMDLEMVGDEDAPVAIVSIVGGQSTGKSTILNHLFGTSFEEMDADDGRHQTTKGIWVAKRPLPRCCLLIIDTEGSDGVEQEDDPKFEKQTALFAVAVSHTIIINMWCHEVGRNQAARWPLLKIVFEVMMRLCDPRTINLIFVLRDKTKSPLESLETQIKDKALKMWKALIKPQDKWNAKLHDYFKIEVVAMSNYEHKRDDFQLEVAGLKDKIISYSTSAGSSNDRIPASGFVNYAKGIWNKIQADKDLDLPQERIMVSEVRCNQIAKENYRKFCENEVWRQIQTALYSKETLKDFGEKVNSLIKYCLSQYDKEALYFDYTIRNEKCDQLSEDLLKVVEPVYLSLIERMSNEALKNFKKSIDLEKELVKKGKDFPEVIQEYIPDFLAELDKQFADARIERASWDHSTKIRQTKESKARAHLDREMSRLLEKLQDLGSGEGIKELLIKGGSVALDGCSAIIKALNYHVSCENTLSSESAKTADTPQPSSSYALIPIKHMENPPRLNLSSDKVVQITKIGQALSSLNNK